MTPVDLSALEQRLIAACEAAIAKGKKITSGIWGVYRGDSGWDCGPCCCVFGAVLLVDNPPRDERVPYKCAVLERVLGIDTGTVAGVMSGFDGVPFAEFRGTRRDAFDLGVRLRARFAEGAL